MNSVAETSVRPVMTAMNVSHGMRTLAGARALMTLRSDTDTAAEQCQHVRTVLLDVSAGDAWIPTPAPG